LSSPGTASLRASATWARSRLAAGGPPSRRTSRPRMRTSSASPLTQSVQRSPGLASPWPSVSTGPEIPRLSGGPVRPPGSLPVVVAHVHGEPGRTHGTCPRWKPHLAHINLGTNDQAGNFSNATFLAEFEQAYVEFAHAISAAYDDTQAKNITFALAWGPSGEPIRRRRCVCCSQPRR